ncbi:MAG: hypothetical protein ACE5R4_10970, partial [Armatimonadota bacterium]
PYDHDQYAGSCGCYNVCGADEMAVPPPSNRRGGSGGPGNHRHVGKNNFGFVDGHVKAYSLEQTVDQGTSDGTGMSMWTISNRWYP